jgi:hypothetical protein
MGRHYAGLNILEYNAFPNMGRHYIQEYLWEGIIFKNI